MSGGLFSIMPLGYKVLKKIENIIREEMEALGGQEALTPLVAPLEIWKKSGRAILADRDLIRFRDRHGKEMVLSPSHEEAMVELIKDGIASYREFPIFLFQFQTKFRDEEKVKAGLIRTKEFIMKDAYSFHRSYTDLNNFFPKVFAAYERIFKKCELIALPAESGVGYMGGDKSFEFFMESPIGDDIVICCENCGYRANRDIAKGQKEMSSSIPKPMEEIETSSCRTMEELSAKLDVPKSSLAKCMVYNTLDGFVMAVVRGDYGVSPEKVSRFIKKPIVRLASEAELELKGLSPGYLSPIGMEGVMPIIVDDTVADSGNLVMGANKPGFHYLNVNFGRDFESPLVGDIAMVKQNNKCLICGKAMKEYRAVELGHIFKLGDYYSKSMDFHFYGENGEKIYPNMGSYGIGLGRLLAAVAENSRDEKGLIWPKKLAPYSVFLMGIGKSASVRHVVEQLYEVLNAEVLLDDRMESPGVKFKDADLLGIPYRIVVSSTLLEKDKVEIYERKTGKVSNVPLEDIINGSRDLPWEIDNME